MKKYIERSESRELIGEYFISSLFRRAYIRNSPEKCQNQSKLSKSDLPLIPLPFPSSKAVLPPPLSLPSCRKPLNLAYFPSSAPDLARNLPSHFPRRRQSTNWICPRRRHPFSSFSSQRTYRQSRFPSFLHQPAFVSLSCLSTELIFV